MRDPVEVDQAAHIAPTGTVGAASPTTAICRTIRLADDAVTACRAAFPAGHRARVAMDDAIIALHEARRGVDVIVL